MTGRRSSFGQVLKERSGRYRARYTAPGAPQRWINAPATFDTKRAAQLWLARERTALEDRRLEEAAAARDGREPTPEPAPPVSFGEYGREWLRRRRLKESTRTLYSRQFAKALEPEWGAVVLTDITPQRVSAWHSSLLPGRPTERAHVYSLFRTILQTAWRESLIPTNPCRVEGGGATGTRAHAIRPASLVELELLTSALPTRLQPMALLGAWCAMRFGEVTALRREDVDLDAGVIRVRRGVTWLTGVPVIDTPKTAAGTRDVAVPPHLLPVLREHLDAEVGRRPADLLFPLEPRSDIPLSPHRFRSTFTSAKAAAGRPDLTFHALRHTGAVLAAATGATVAELMARLGHTTPTMAMRYQHAAADRDKVIAEALSRLASATR